MAARGLVNGRDPRRRRGRDSAFRRVVSDTYTLIFTRMEPSLLSEDGNICDFRAFCENFFVEWSIRCIFAAVR